MNETHITAYALNELEGNERDVFETDLAADPRLPGELQAASRVADALARIMTEPREGLEPQARENLLRAIAANQEAFRLRRKIVRLAVPVSLAAAASIAVLLWVAGGTTTREPAVAAARGPGEEKVHLISSANEPPDPTGFAAGGMRTVIMSEKAKALQGASSLTQPPMQQRSLLSSEQIPLWGSGNP